MQPIAECCGDLLNQEDLEMPQIRGISHIDLTVSNCERAAAWRQDVLGFTLVHRTRGETFETMSLVHPSGVGVTVMSHDGTPELGAFDERRVGLDHLAFGVADVEELQRWVAHFEAKRVKQSGIIDISYGATIVFRDPDNMQLELYVQQSVDQLQLSEADSEQARRVAEKAQAGHG